MAASPVEWLANELGALAERYAAAPPSPEEAVPNPARDAALSSLARLQAMLQGPSQFLQHLVTENQTLSCLRWLCEFHVLACIPLGDSVAVRDLADLLSIPRAHLEVVVRMMAAVGFLCQPQAGHVAHTALSACFLSDLSLADAAQFLGECVAPSALHMAEMSRRHMMDPRSPSSSSATCTTGATPRAAAHDGTTAFSLARTTPSVSSHAAWDHDAKLHRQWAAFLTHACGIGDMGTSDILARFDWFNLGSACIVEVGAESCTTADMLSGLCPDLSFVVQFHENGPAAPPAELAAAYARSVRANRRITVQQRRIGGAQPVRDAAAYILRLPSVMRTVPAFIASTRSAAASRPVIGRRELITAELGAHLDVLHANSSAMLILTATLKRPDAAAATAQPRSQENTSTTKRLPQFSDLLLLQLASREPEMEIADLLNIVDGVADESGKLSVVHRLTNQDTTDVALVVQYQKHTA